MSLGTASRRERLTFAADGCLMTAGAFGAMAGIAFILEWIGLAPMTEPQGTGLALVASLISWLLQVGGFVVGPALAWRLHGRPLDRVAILGGLLGLPFGMAAVVPVAMIGAFTDWLFGLFIPVEFVGAITWLVVVVLAFLAMLVWLDLAAVRDLRTDRRTHVRLDAGRLVATLAVVAFAAVVVGMMIAGKDALEAGVFLLAAGVEGAAVVTVADLVGTVWRNRTPRDTAGDA